MQCGATLLEGITIEMASRYYKITL